MTRADAVNTTVALALFAAVAGGAWFGAVTSALDLAWAWFWFDVLIAAFAWFGVRECWRALDAGALALLPEEPNPDADAEAIIEELGSMGR